MRYHRKLDGTNVPFTPEEEAIWDEMDAANQAATAIENIHMTYENARRNVTVSYNSKQYSFTKPEHFSDFNALITLGEETVVWFSDDGEMNYLSQYDLKQIGILIKNAIQTAFLAKKTALQNV